ncbi:MAG TPA: hypothetical protein VFY36_09650 [Solirubrobacteraceae bacterium]|nr:hypothetical protein [Solirubrobacteraceae bacterium]
MVMIVSRKLAVAEAAFALAVGVEVLAAKLQSHPHLPAAHVSFYSDPHPFAGATSSYTASGYTALPPHGPVDARPPLYVIRPVGL